MSAIYHTGTWSPRVWAFLRRFDHSNIFLLIAGSYTPFSLLLLDGTARVALLGHGLDRRHPRRAVPDLLDRRPALALHADLHRAGLGRGLLHPRLPPRRHRARPRHRHRDLRDDPRRRRALHFGGVVYGFKRPNPWPRWFGFHEVFHTFTVLAFVAHYVGVSMATYSLR